MFTTCTYKDRSTLIPISFLIVYRVFKSRASKGHVLPVSSYNASSSSLEKKEKKREASERDAAGLSPVFTLHRANTVVHYFAVPRTPPEVLRLLRGIDVPVSDVVECTNQGVGYPRTFTARHEVEDPTVPSATDRFDSTYKDTINQ